MKHVSAAIYIQIWDADPTLYPPKKFDRFVAVCNQSKTPLNYLKLRIKLEIGIRTKI